MRSRSLVVAVVASLSLAACSDSPSTTAPLTPFGQAPANLTLGEYIDQQILALLPTGHEKSVAARWSTVQKKKNSGDMKGAVSHFISLADWLLKKTGDFTPPVGTTKAQASAHLVVTMANWLFGGPGSTPPGPAGPDVAVGIAPAGQPFLLQTPSLHAGVSWPAGSTNEDRLIVLAQDPTPYPGLCTGPLVTPRCQYPLFYTLHSYPDLRLNQNGRVAICMVETGDRRPLEYLSDENGARPIDDRMRLAHDLPTSPADYTAGAVQEGLIEILPKAAQQTGTLVECDEPDTQAMGRLERALYAASRFVGKFISPKSAWAWDLGPEHQFADFSHFNGVDPESDPDLALTGVDIVTIPATTDLGQALTWTVTNASRRTTGEATGAAPASTLTAYSSNDAVLDAGDAVLFTRSVPAMLPDAAPVTGSAAIDPGDYSYVIVQVVGPATEVSMDNNVVVLQLAERAPDPPPTNTSAQQPTIDTDVGFLAIGSPVSKQQVAQVFTAPANGYLSQVSFPVACSGDQPLIVEIYPVPASVGYPKGDVLYSTSVPAASLPPFAAGQVSFRDIPLPDGPTLVQGQQYGIVLTVRDRTQSACSVASGPTGDPYDGGSGWYDSEQSQLGVWRSMSPRNDLPFKTVVTLPIFY